MKMNPPSNLRIDKDFNVAFTAAEEPGIDIADRHQITLIGDPLAPALLSVSTTATEFNLKAIPTGAQVGSVEYHPGINYTLMVLGFAAKRRSDAASINFIVNEIGEVVMVPPTAAAEKSAETSPASSSTAPAVTPVQTELVLAPQPRCGIVGSTLSITPQDGEDRYTVYAVKTNGENEQLVGEAGFTGAMVGSAIQVKDFFARMTWTGGHPVAGNYSVHVFALDAAGNKSRPAVFREIEYVPAEEKATKVTGATAPVQPPQPTPPAPSNPVPVAPAPKPVATTTPAVTPSAGSPAPTSDEDVDTKIPERLAAIRRDLAIIDNWPLNGQRRILRSMQYALEEMARQLEGKQQTDKTDKLRAEVDNLLVEVIGARTRRSEQWTVITGRLSRILEIAKQIGSQPGQPGAELVSEATTIKNVMAQLDVNFEDVEALMPSSRALMERAEDLRRAHAQARKTEAAAKVAASSTPAASAKPAPVTPPDTMAATTTSAVAAQAANTPAGGAKPDKNEASTPTTPAPAILPKDASESIWQQIHAAEDALDGDGADTEKTVTIAIRNAERSMARAKRQYPASADEFQSMETALKGLNTDLAAWKKKKGEEAATAEKEKRERERQDAESKGKDKRKDGWFNPLPPILTWLKRRWPLALMLLALLALLWYAQKNGGVPDAISGIFKGSAQGASTPKGFVPGQIGMNTPGMAGAPFNNAERIRVRNEVKGDLIGDGNIVGNGQVIVNMVTNTYNYNYGGQPQGPSVHNTQTPRTPAPQPAAQSKDYCYTVNLTPGQVYSREIEEPLKWKVNMVIDSRVNDLKVELQSMDGEWHTMKNGTEDRIPYVKAVRLTATPDADRITVNFRLSPRD